MLAFIPMLACHGGFDLPPGVAVVVGAVIVAWLALIGLGLVNLLLMFSVSRAADFWPGHRVLVAISLLLTVYLLYAGMNNLNDAVGVIVLVACGLPVLNIGQFIALMVARHELKRARQRENLPE